MTTATAARRREGIEALQSWQRGSLTPADWLVRLPPECLAELRATLAALRRSPLPLLLLNPADHALPACRALMRGVRAQLDHGIMFAVLDRLPLGEMSGEEGVALYWLLASLLARPVVQKLDGTMLYEVRDTGARLAPGSGIRPTVTNVDLTFHNDNSYNETPPDYVALFCRQVAAQGGISRVISVPTVHQRLRQRAPALLPRLYENFWYDRHREHRADEPTTHAAPIFENVGFENDGFEDDGALRARLALLEIRGGYQLRGEGMDGRTADALAAVESVFADPDLYIEMMLEPGQVQIVNNRRTGHARTEFRDDPETGRCRHLVRLWLRDRGGRGYRG